MALSPEVSFRMLIKRVNIIFIASYFTLDIHSSIIVCIAFKDLISCSVKMNDALN